MKTYQIDDDRWIPLERAATLVRMFHQVPLTARKVLDALAIGDKREPTFDRWEVRYGAFVAKALQMAKTEQPTKAKLIDRVTALEAQLALDRRRNDAAIEALQKQIDQLSKFTTTIGK